MRKIEESITSQIVPMYETGLTYREIAERLGISHVTVGRIVRDAGLDKFHVGGKISKSLPVTNDRLPEPSRQPENELLITSRTITVHGCATGVDYTAGTHTPTIDIVYGDWMLCIERNKLSGFINELEQIRKMIGAR